MREGLAMFSDLRYRLRALFRRSEMESELDQELRCHFEHEGDSPRARSGASPMRTSWPFVGAKGFTGSYAIRPSDRESSRFSTT